MGNSKHTKKAEHTRPIVLIVGTRPEGIKMIPLYQALKKSGLPALLCSTMQHDELLSQVFDIFGITPDFNLEIMRQKQDLFYLTQSILQKTKELFAQLQPSLVIVQGDTTSTMAAALSAFYAHIPVAHVEAGLRTDDIQHPFPEEANRRIVSQIANYHFAPTQLAYNNLISQGVAKETIFLTGNTVTDALRIIQDKITTDALHITDTLKQTINTCKKQNKKIILLTAHRRESFNGGIEQILNSVKTFLLDNPGTCCIYPFHPNPQVIQAIEKTDISNLENLHITEPIQYSDMVYLISHANIILTDSGGIQEEAISLGKPVLILREKTERMEGVQAGLATLVGTNGEKIIQKLNTHHNLKSFKSRETSNIYGDGHASEKITVILKNKLLDKLDNLPKLQKDIFKGATHNREKLKSKLKGNLSMKKACVLGLGYIGLPTAILLAENGFDVTGFDIDAQKVESINAGDPVIEEPEIYEKLHIALSYKHLKATTKIQASDYFIIAVPTPFKENKAIDLSYIKSAAISIAKVLQTGNTVLLESTVSVGATEKLAQLLQEKTKLRAGKDFHVAHCPERVLPGKIFKELVENDRVIGGITPESAYKASLLYNTFVTGDIHLTDCKTAEMVKLIENSSRDAQIAFAHQVASMAKAAKLNPYEIIELANKHPRVNILRPTCGVGGHCIAIDPWFLVESFPNNCEFIKAARATNDNRPLEIIKTINKKIKKWEIANNTPNTPRAKKCTVLLLGLTYKPNVDDLRESPALFIAKEMRKHKNINLLIAEPNIKQQKLQTLFAKTHTSIQDGIAKADIIVYLVAHKRFKAIDKKLLKHKLILDFCGATYISKTKNPEPTKTCMLDFFITNSRDTSCCKKDKGSA
ncbi:non-hydrolyzing UDP-N-acetylglucosamine 2-epimerase [Candidatus Dependentiae bacterium]